MIRYKSGIRECSGVKSGGLMIGGQALRPFPQRRSPGHHSAHRSRPTLPCASPVPTPPLPGHCSRAPLPGAAPGHCPRRGSKAPAQALLSGAPCPSAERAGRSALLGIPTTMSSINRTPGMLRVRTVNTLEHSIADSGGQRDIRPMSYIPVLRNSSGLESRYRQRSDQPICRAIC